MEFTLEQLTQSIVNALQVGYVDFSFAQALSFALAPMFSGIFVGFALSALDIFVGRRGALDKNF